MLKVFGGEVELGSRCFVAVALDELPELVGDEEVVDASVAFVELSLEESERWLWWCIPAAAPAPAPTPAPKPAPAWPFRLPPLPFSLFDGGAGFAGGFGFDGGGGELGLEGLLPELLPWDLLPDEEDVLPRRKTGIKSTSKAL